MTWQVYEGGGTYLAGTPLHGPPSTSRHLPVSLLSGCHHPRHPPCEQGLAAVVQSGGRRPLAVSQPSLFFP